MMSKPSLLDVGVIRHRGKIESTITNAQAALRIIEDHGSLAKFMWTFVNYQPILTDAKSLKGIPAETDESKAMSKALKKAGFKFCGATICYAFMQAAGMVNDHVIGCPQRQECLEALGISPEALLDSARAVRRDALVCPVIRLGKSLI